MSSPLSLPSAYDLVAFESIGSTNDEAKRRAEDGAADGTLIWAREQIQGRGRRGRYWTSPVGNLYLSIILRPDCSVGEAARLSFATAVALADAITECSPLLREISHKWPNDVLVRGRKCAGILLESSLGENQSLDWMIMGAGVNLLSHPEGTEFPATDLAAEGAGAIAVEDMLEAFARHFQNWREIWQDKGFQPVRDGWLARAHGLGERMKVRIGEERFAATFLDLAEDGALLARLDDGRVRRVEAGEVFPVAA
jgi:BirA family biotin operon repressor/biotin-[acetyl-CoA-carboxylase] ligase